MTLTLAEMAVEVLTTADGREKTALGRRHAAAWFAARAAGPPLPIGRAEPPLRPARPEKPDLLPPKDVPRRRPGTLPGRLALLHEGRVLATGTPAEVLHPILLRTAYGVEAAILPGPDGHPLVLPLRAARMANEV